MTINPSVRYWTCWTSSLLCSIFSFIRLLRPEDDEAKGDGEDDYGEDYMGSVHKENGRAILTEVSPSAFSLASLKRRLFLLLGSLGWLCCGLLDRCGALSGLALRHLDTSFLVESPRFHWVTPLLPSSGCGVPPRRSMPSTRDGIMRLAGRALHIKYDRVAPIPAGVISFQSAHRPPCGNRVQLLTCISSRHSAVKMFRSMSYTGVSISDSTVFEQRLEEERVEVGR
jgi:hypothetical protein